jgi:hypothetical protein
MLYHYILDKVCNGGPILSNFKIGESILQNGKNRGTKTVIKINDEYILILFF